MNDDALSDVLELPVPERIRAVQVIWDSVAEQPDLVPVTPEQRAILEQRLREYRENPDGVSTWTEVERRLRSRD